MHSILLIKEVWLNIVINNTLEETPVILSDITIWLECSSWKLLGITDQNHFVWFIEKWNNIVWFSALVKKNQRIINPITYQSFQIICISYLSSFIYNENFNLVFEPF